MSAHTPGPGARRRFAYPAEFVTLPDYTAHAGRLVTVIRALDDAEADAGEVERMYVVRTDDGWTGHAFESELAEVGNE